jgi:hypothetical protein
MEHGFRQRGELGALHTAPDNGHEPSRKLVVGNAIVSDSFDEKFDFLAGEFRSVAFFADDVNSAHEVGPPSKLASV